MGAHPPGRSCFGAIHLGELDRRAGRVLHKGSFNSFAWSYPCSSGDHWRHYGLVSGKQASCCPGNFAFSTDSPSYRRSEIDIHEIGARRTRPSRPVIAVAMAPMGRLSPFNAKQIAQDRPQARGYSSSSLGAVSGDQGLVL